MVAFAQFIRVFSLGIVGITAFGIGLTTGYVVLEPSAVTVDSQGNSNQITPAVPSNGKNKATDLRLVLQQLQQEHMHLLAITLQANYNRSSELGAANAQLKANVQETGELFESYYGSMTKDEYINFQLRYITSFTNYTNAARTGNKGILDASLAELIVSTQAQAELFHKANPALPKDGIKQLSTDTIMLMKESIDAYAQREYPLAYTKQRQAYVQIGLLADAHATALVKRFPEKFKN